MKRAFHKPFFIIFEMLSFVQYRTQALSTLNDLNLKVI